MGLNFLKSKNVKIYPTARRGKYKETSNNSSATYIYDPEARLETEYNKVHHFSKTVAKNSYIIAWDNFGTVNSKLRCVIDGYYFEITGAVDYKYLGIQTKDISLVSNNTDTRSTKLIIATIRNQEGQNIATVNDALDTVDGNFLGLVGSDDANDLTGYEILQLFIDDNHTILNPSAFLIDSVILTDVGYASIVGKDEETDSKKANCSKGKYSITFGTKNQNMGDFGLVYGESNNNSGEHNILIGIANINQTHVEIDKTSHEEIDVPNTNVILIGNGAEATNNNQVILKGYDYLNFADRLVLDNDEIAINVNNAVTESNIFELTNSRTNNGLTTVITAVTVDSEGNTSINGNFSSHGLGQSTFDGNLTVGKSATISGGLEVGGAATLKNNLQVAGNVTLGTIINDPETNTPAINNTLTINANTTTAGTINTSNDITMTSANSKLSIAGNIENTNYTFTNSSATLYGSQIDATTVLLPTQKIIFGDPTDSDTHHATINYDSTQGILEIIC